jgi:4-nitrophenyl phosphatase
MNLNSLHTLLIDGDGVLWRANDAVPGLDRLFEVIARRGMRWALLTNNNTRTVADYVSKLRGFGIEAGPEQVFTSSTVTAGYLARRYGAGAPVHAVGMSGLIDTLIDAGFTVTTGEEAPPHPVVAVAAGMDRAITHEKIKIAMRLILGGAEFVATNTDSSFPTPDGLNPGTGMVIGALQATTEIAPTIIGKPQVAIFRAAMEHLGADPATTAMLGDRLETDIQGAQNAGIGSIAVLTGVTSREQIAASTIRPDLVLESIAELAEALDAGAA